MPSCHSIHARWVVLACCLSAAAAGCARQSVHAPVPAPVLPAPDFSEAERPMTTAPDTDAAPPVETTSAPPELAAESAPPLVSVPATKPPRRPIEQPVTEAAAETPARPPAPQISPQFSPLDQASYERKTNDDVAVARKNLQAARGKQLNAAQQDLVDKIRSFLAQSLDASKGGDWARAQNLAQKARLLSVELVNSF
ncbi:MAG: hypothetical protein ABSA57_14555 [Candidatus Acidiferrales bacterium]